MGIIDKIIHWTRCVRIHRAELYNMNKELAELREKNQWLMNFVAESGMYTFYHKWPNPFNKSEIEKLMEKPFKPMKYPAHHQIYSLIHNYQKE